MVARLPSPTGTVPPPPRGSVQHDLGAAGRSDFPGKRAQGEIPHSRPGRFDQLFDLPPLRLEDGGSKMENRGSRIEDRGSRGERGSSIENRELRKMGAMVNTRSSILDPQSSIFALIRQRLAASQGKQYWRSLEELADDEGFQEL